VTETGRTWRARRRVVLPLAVVLLATGAAVVVPDPTPAAGAVVGPGDFTITSEVLATPSGAFPAASCSGSGALLAPGTVRCVVFTVTNSLSSPILVTSITSALADSSSTLPAECVGDNLLLPEFTGALSVPAGSTRTSLGVPVMLVESGIDQDACQGVTYDFVYTGSAQVTEGAAPISVEIVQAGAASALGVPVAFTASVTGAPVGTTPTGTVTFFGDTLMTGARALGTVPLDGAGTAQLPVSSLPEGTNRVFAAYSGDATFAGATSVGIVHTVVRPPARCTGVFPSTILGDPLFPNVSGTTGRDLVVARGGQFTVRGNGGNDCLIVGDRTQTVVGGSGDDVVIAGNGRKTVSVGAGNNVLVLGRGAARVSAASGANRVTLTGASGSVIRLGNGNNIVTVVGGSKIKIVLGNGRNVVRLTGGAKQVTIRAGSGRNVVYLGLGRGNSFSATKRTNVCHVPRPPRSWQGSPVGYYRDRVVNCRVVTP
jgi:hypothetical protein